jgi:hypothetical protein
MFHKTNKIRNSSSFVVIGFFRQEVDPEKQIKLLDSLFASHASDSPSIYFKERCEIFATEDAAIQNIKERKKGHLPHFYIIECKGNEVAVMRRAAKGKFSEGISEIKDSDNLLNNNKTKATK